jgi:mannose-6-phosphate isomerase
VPQFPPKKSIDRLHSSRSGNNDFPFRDVELIVAVVMPAPLLRLLPNRVRRNYRGGYLLDKLEGKPSSADGERPEDWLASTVRAVNPGLSPIPDEGLARVETGAGQQERLDGLLRTHPDYYLGVRHVETHGTQLGFLAKLLDSAMRLHVQAHPTAAFAREHLHSRWGKLETYVILALRNADSAYIRLGFQRPPTPEEWRRIVLEQDIAAMDACFDSIPIRVGEVWLVPGGLPHAIGEGVLMLEVMEPSDLVVRCEFEREGAVVPPAARFMQSPVDLALQIFDYTPRSVAEVEAAYRIAPQALSATEEGLIGPAQTDCFSISRTTAPERIELPSPGCLRIGVVAGGRGTIAAEGARLALEPGSRFLLAAEVPGAELAPTSDEPLQVLFCSPGRAD